MRPFTLYYENLAEVGGYPAFHPGFPLGEEIRGMSEFDLTGMGHVSSAILTFTVYRQGGMFPDTNDTPFTGTILIDAYAGNNSESAVLPPATLEELYGDYQAASIGDVGAFEVVGGDTPSPDVGALFTFNITGLFNEAIAHDLISLGIRLRQDREDDEYFSFRAWTFGEFQITVTPAPEPGTLALLAVGLAGLAFSRRNPVPRGAP